LIHDQGLLDRLAALQTEPFEGEVFRATRVNADPTAPSINGGRWPPPPDGDAGVSVLYTSFERNGALAEVCSFLAMLTPIPGPRPIKVTRLAVATSRTLKLAQADLQGLGIDLQSYGERDYGLTQRIGAALAFLEIDGLIAPSARWPCNNLMIFTDNHTFTARLEAIDSEEVEWRSWAREHSFLAS
jgi:hypothetical protein